MFARSLSLPSTAHKWEEMPELQRWSSSTAPWTQGQDVPSPCASSQRCGAGGASCCSVVGEQLLGSIVLSSSPIFCELAQCGWSPHHAPMWHHMVPQWLLLSLGLIQCEKLRLLFFKFQEQTLPFCYCILVTFHPCAVAEFCVFRCRVSVQLVAWGAVWGDLP